MFPWTLIYSVPISIVVWLTTTLLTEPVSEAQLITFYQRVQPGGPGWRHIAGKIGAAQNLSPLLTRQNIICAILGIVAVYSALLGTGHFILRRYLWATALLFLLLISTHFLIRLLSTEKWQ